MSIDLKGSSPSSVKIKVLKSIRHDGSKHLSSGQLYLVTVSLFKDV